MFMEHCIRSGEPAGWQWLKAKGSTAAINQQHMTSRTRTLLWHSIFGLLNIIEVEKLAFALWPRRLSEE
jgi:hypothetical protein